MVHFEAQPGQDAAIGLQRFLLVVRAGRKSLHSHWISPDSRRNFTLLVAAYEDLGSYPDNENVIYRNIPGTKLRGLTQLFEHEPELLEGYTHIAVLDDDIETNAVDLSRLFEAGVREGLEIWQPALIWNSYFSYAVFLENPATDLRYCNFIELMCPFFTAQALKRALPLFAMGYETGIDRFWCRLSDDPAFKYAIIDAVTVTHTRPIGTTAAQQGFKNGYDEVFQAMERRYNVAFRGPVVYAGILKSGTRFKSRLLATMISLAALGALFKTPARKGFCWARLADHVRHNLTRPINNSRIELSEKT